MKVLLHKFLLNYEIKIHKKREFVYETNFIKYLFWSISTLKLTLLPFNYYFSIN